MLRSEDTIIIAERLKLAGYKSLKEYYCSPQWSEVRQAFKKRKCCVICESRFSLQLHHNSYCSLCDEEDRHLDWLCHECHDLLHKLSVFNDFDLIEAKLCARDCFLSMTLPWLKEAVRQYDDSFCSIQSLALQRSRL